MAYTLPTDATIPITGIYTFFLYLNNDVCGGYLFTAIIFAIAIILFISLKDYPSSKAFATSAYMTFIFALLLRAVDLLPNKVLYLSIILMAVGFVWVHIDNKSSF